MGKNIWEMLGAKSGKSQGKQLSSSEAKSKKKDHSLAQAVRGPKSNLESAEAALKESGEKFRVIFESANDGIALADVKTKQFYMINKKFQEMLGYSAKEIKRMGVLEIHPKKDLPYVLDQFDKQAKKIISLSKDLPVRRKDGGVFYADVNSFPITLARKQYLVGMFRDVTERKRVEEALRDANEKWLSFTKNTNDIIILTDSKGTLLYINKTIPLYTSADAIGKPLFNFVPKEQHNIMRMHLAKVFKTGEPDSYEISSDIPKAGIFWFSTKLIPIKSNEKVKKVIMISTEITERKKAEEVVKGYATKLEAEVTVRTKQYHDESNRAEALSVVKDEFIQNVSHELKTPLSVILVNLLLLRDIAPIDKQQEWMKILDMLDRNSTRLSGSINQILQLSKLNSSELKKEKVYIQNLIAEVYKEHLPLAKMKNLEFKAQAEPAIIIGDSSLLQLAINNLVSNAIKFTNKDSVIIKSTAYDKGVSISVIDTGIGISPENKNKLFEKFFKVNPNATGTGIGLTIVKQIIEKHGGSINIKSKLGKGSTFEMILPRGTEKID